MLIVRDDPDLVEADLAAGRFNCPTCEVGVLARWGFSRRRELRDGQRFRPRRGMCRGCGHCHVLLPDVCLLRRHDSAEVIGTAISARGDYWVIADALGVPRETVKSWLRRFSSMAERIRAHFTSWVVALVPGRALPEPAGSKRADALEAIGAATKAAALHLETTRTPWAWASALSAGKLISNTNALWPAPG